MHKIASVRLYDKDQHISSLDCCFGFDYYNKASEDMQAIFKQTIEIVAYPIPSFS